MRSFVLENGGWKPPVRWDPEGKDQGRRMTRLVPEGIWAGLNKEFLS